MKDKLYIKREEIVESIYSTINSEDKRTIDKKLIEEVIVSQSNFTVDKIEEGGFETIIWKGMGKFIPNFNTLKKIIKNKYKNGKSN